MIRIYFKRFQNVVDEVDSQFCRILLLRFIPSPQYQKKREKNSSQAK